MSLEEADVSFQQLMRELSQHLLQELRGIRGERGLMLVIDDSKYERERVEQILTDHAKKGKAKYVISTVSDEIAGIVNLYHLQDDLA